jgi:hypothetical protein
MSDRKSLSRTVRLHSSVNGSKSFVDNQRMKKGEKIKHGKWYRDIWLE